MFIVAGPPGGGKSTTFPVKGSISSALMIARRHSIEDRTSTSHIERRISCAF
jgi:type II secretory ATPase GspE/PulE/Tfp pilus assembly ATPase PilB-like protein